MSEASQRGRVALWGWWSGRPARQRAQTRPGLGGGRLAARVLPAAVLLVITMAGCSAPGGPAKPAPPDPLRRGDPVAVAGEFVQRYVVGDPSACLLADGRLRDQLARLGRCGLRPPAARPALPPVQTVATLACGADEVVRLGLGVPPAGRLDLTLAPIPGGWATASLPEPVPTAAAPACPTPAGN